MTLHTEFGVNCKKVATTDIKEQVFSIWTKERMFYKCKISLIEINNIINSCLCTYRHR